MNTSIPLVDLKAQYLPLKDEIRRAWDGILDSMHLFLGENVHAFEYEFANFCRARHGIGVSDGTMALFLALKACGVGRGDEVITVAHTFVATVEAIVMAGARPVFVDIDPVTYTMDPALVESQITRRTRAILPVHLYGQCADMDALMEIARRYGIHVIEDACQAHGATYKGSPAGSLGSMAAFSFYFSKNLGGYGEGGFVTTNNPDLAHKVRLMRDHGSEKRYVHATWGLNARLDELQAAALRIKLRHLEEWNEQRRLVALYYDGALSRLALDTPTCAPHNRHVYHLYVIQTEERDALREHLQQQGIGSGVHYPIPVHLQKPYRKYGPGAGGLPVTEAACRKILSLPIYAELTAAQVGRVADEISLFQESRAISIPVDRLAKKFA